MIKHIVMWKLKEEAESGIKEENALKIKSLLESLVGVIPEILFLEVGININNVEGAYDVVLNSHFETMETLSVYQKHPEHKKVGAFVGAVSDKRAAVDFQV